MPSDLESTRLGYFNSGLALGAQYGEGLELKLRKQAQASQAADRRIRERELAARISQIDLENQKLTAEIQAKAAADAEWLNVNTDLHKAETAFQTAREMGEQQPAPDFTALRDEAAMRLAGSNPNAQKYLAGRAAAENFRNDIAKRERDAQLLPLQMESEQALAKQRNASADRSSTGRAYTKPELEKIFDLADQAGQPYTPAQKRDAMDVHLGLKAKEGTETAPPSEGVWVSRHLQDFMATRPRRLDAKGKTEYLTDDEALEVLHERYNKIMRKADVGAARPASTPDMTLVPVIAPDGTPGKIPKANLDKALQRGYKLRQ